MKAFSKKLVKKYSWWKMGWFYKGIIKKKEKKLSKIWWTMLSSKSSRNL